jgi:hypothetical protein
VQTDEKGESIMKSRKLLTTIVAIVLMMAFTVGSAQADPLDLPSTPTATLNIKVDGVPMTVKAYNVVYVANPVEVQEVTSSTGYTYDYQAMNIYVPSNAKEDSPIILQDNNGGWNGGKPGTSLRTVQTITALPTK